MKKIVSLVVIVAIVVGGIIFVPKLVNTCDHCEKTFFGTGYVAAIENAVSSLINSDSETILCRDCAEEYYALATAFGGDLEDYKRPLFD